MSFSVNEVHNMYDDRWGYKAVQYDEYGNIKWSSEFYNTKKEAKEVMISEKKRIKEINIYCEGIK
jgi:hypothetical protein